VKSFLLFSLFFAFSFGSGVFTYSSANATLTNGNNFQFRALQFVEVSIPLVYSGVYIASESVTINPVSATFDGLFGAAYTSLINAPTVWLSFIEDAATWTKVNGAGNITSANATVAEGFIGSTFISLDEVTANGSLIQSIALQSLGFSITDQNLLTGLRYVTFTGATLLHLGFQVTVSYIATNQVGVLNVGAVAVLTPLSIESVINITNFPYVSKANSVRLNIGIGSQALTLQLDGTFTHFVGGSGTSATYVTVNNQVLVNGVVKPASVSRFIDVAQMTDFGNGDIAGQITAKYAAAASFKIVSVTFPPGAASIVFDPAVGAGSPPPSVSGYYNASIKVVIPLALIFFLLALLF